MNRLHLRRAMTMVELLIAFSVLSLALAPLCYLFSFSSGDRQTSDREVFANLLAHHVLESILAARLEDPQQLPAMSAEEDIVGTDGQYHQTSAHFARLLGASESARPGDHPQLFAALRGYRCKVDTYYLDHQLYRVLVFVSFEEGGRRKQVYLERMLGQRAPTVAVARVGIDGVVPTVGGAVSAAASGTAEAPVASASSVPPVPVVDLSPATGVPVLPPSDDTEAEAASAAANVPTPEVAIIPVFVASAPTTIETASAPLVAPGAEVATGSGLMTPDAVASSASSLASGGDTAIQSIVSVATAASLPTSLASETPP